MSRAQEIADLLSGVTITTADNLPQLTLKSTDADGGRGPDLVLTRDSASPADGDAIGFISWTADNDAGADHAFCGIEVLASDVSDGSEDATWQLFTQVAGTSRSRFSATPTETVLNEDSQDLDFRVESNGNANMFVVDANTDKIGIGTAAPNVTVEMAAAVNGALSGVTNRNPIIQLSNSDTGYVAGNATAIDFATTLNYANASIICRNDNSGSGFGGSLIFATSPTSGNSLAERARIDNTGAIHVGKTAYVGAGTDGVTISGTSGNGNQFVVASTTSGAAGSFNRNSDDGGVIHIRKAGTLVGVLGVSDSDNFFIDCQTSSHSGLTFATANITPRLNGSQNDGNVDLGAGSARFLNIYATNATIQTSDQNEKEQIASLTTAEMTAAKAISKLFKTFKWKHRVAAEGDAARTHSGVIAQEVQTAMSDAGLDASKYAFWCSDTWWETSTDVPAVEAVEYADAVFDDDNNLVSPAVMPVEAKDAYTYTTTYKTADEAPEGATKHTRLGVRYPELLSFVGAATEQRLADIETRLSALEAG